MRLIGIAAPKGSGKTTFAEMLKRGLEDNFQQQTKVFPFAGPLKEACWALFGGERRHWYGSDQDKNEPFTYWSAALGEMYSTPRRILQTVGTNVFRQHVDKEFWLVAFNKKLKDNITVPVVIVDDVRFENEAKYIRQVGGTIIHLTRLNINWNKEHESECGPGFGDGTDVKFNFDNLVEMKLAVNDIVRNILKQKAIEPL